MIRTSAVAVAALVLLAVSGCTSNTAPSAASPSPTPTATVQGDPSTKQAPPPSGLTAAEAAAAIAAARDTMTRYAQPTLTKQAWIDNMDPVLTQDAAGEFAGTDPSQIPAHQVTGTPTLAAESTANGAIASVPTDAGTYQVFLIRTSGSSEWLAEQITPPGN